MILFVCLTLVHFNRDNMSNNKCAHLVSFCVSSSQVDVAELLVDKGLAKFIDNRVVPHSPIDVLPATVVKPEAQTPPSTSEPTSERPTGPASSTSQCSGQTVDRRPTGSCCLREDCLNTG